MVGGAGSMGGRAARLALALLLALAAGGAGAAPGRLFAEAWLSNPSPFVREPLLYTVRVYSSIDLRTLTIKPPVVPDATLERVDERNVTGAVTLDGTRYVTSDTRYIVTPLQAGGLHVGPARVEVTYGGGPAGPAPGEETFHSEPLKLKVRPAKGVESDWRPLQWLDLRATVEDAGAPRVGQPIILSVDIRARGTRGEELPSVATQLAVPGFKVYPERPRVDTRVRQPGHVWGRRVESYTVIPTRDGHLEIPALEIGWWDLNRDRAVTERVPARELRVLPALAREARAAPDGAPAAADPAAGVGTFFLWVLVALAGGYALYWLLGDAGGGLLRGQLIRRRCGDRCRRGLGRVRQALARLREGTARALDRSLPLGVLHWWWRRRARRAADAAALAEVLRGFGRIRLGLPRRVSPHRVGEGLAAGALADEAEVIHHLVHQLDDARYGRKVLDLVQWREEWELVLGGCLRRTGRRRAPAEAAVGEGLPALNP
ncbi:MAG: BatD family protein [Myxococcota bacterium]|nr:BatD family protein [Myxococcota bacterium]